MNLNVGDVVAIEALDHFSGGSDCEPVTVTFQGTIHKIDRHYVYLATAWYGGVDSPSRERPDISGILRKVIVRVARINQETLSSRRN